MAATDAKIRLTVELDRELYESFHRKTKEVGATHVGAIRVLVRKYVTGVCTCGQESGTLRRAK